MTEVRSVPALQLDRYLGQWFEIGRLPLRFEDEGARDITATYSLNDEGTVRVDNRCLDEDGKPTQAVGEAVPDPEHPGRLRVTSCPRPCAGSRSHEPTTGCSASTRSTSTRSSGRPTTSTSGC